MPTALCFVFTFIIPLKYAPNVTQHWKHIVVFIEHRSFMQIAFHCIRSYQLCKSSQVFNKLTKQKKKKTRFILLFLCMYYITLYILCSCTNINGNFFFLVLITHKKKVGWRKNVGITYKNLLTSYDPEKMKHRDWRPKETKSFQQKSSFSCFFVLNKTFEFVICFRYFVFELVFLYFFQLFKIGVFHLFSR